MEYTTWEVRYLPITKQPAVYAGDELIAGGLTEANAHLISAAPELYEALKAIWTITAPKCHQPIIKQINAVSGKALAKAEGR